MRKESPQRRHHRQRQGWVHASHDRVWSGSGSSCRWPRCKSPPSPSPAQLQLRNLSCLLVWPALPPPGRPWEGWSRCRQRRRGWGPRAFPGPRRPPFSTWTPLVVSKIHISLSNHKTHSGKYDVIVVFLGEKILPWSNLFRYFHLLSCNHPKHKTAK